VADWPGSCTHSPGTALGGVVGHGFQLLGDTDDGLDRTVRLRPHGTQEWCEISANSPSVLSA
jgi:hypothetical protein